MQHHILSIQHLSHKYSKRYAIQDINIEIRQTGIVGLLGSNGAGKSTTMNIMCGVLNQTEGNVMIDGIDLKKNPEAAKKRIGFLPQMAPLYLDLTVDEYLKYCAEFRLLDGRRVRTAIGEAKERCGIAHIGGRLIKNLSGGYRQRVGIAQAIIHQPRLVVLDEPTNGLDPNQLVGVRALIREIALDRTVIFSSHILSEVQLLCHEIIMIEGGKIVFADSMDAFQNYVEPHSVVLQLENPPRSEKLLEIPGITRVDFLSEKQIRLYFQGGAEITERIIEASVKYGWRMQEIGLDKSSIDEIFSELSKPNINEG